MIAKTKNAVTSRAAKLSLIASSALLLVGAGCGPAAEKPVIAPAPDTTDNANAAVNAPVEDAAAPAPAADAEKPSAAAPTPAPSAATTKYKDGTYNVTGHYTSPAGPEEIKVSITIKGDVIADATVTPQATNPISIKMQNAFTSGYKTLVVGKKIDEVQLVAAVSGSSLTPKGFNEAIATVKAEAKS